MSLTPKDATRIWVAAMDHTQAAIAEAQNPGSRASAHTEAERQKLRRVINEYVQEEENTP